MQTAGRTEYDYIVVGAGSSGCALANRLSADPGVRVLLLEAGGWDRDPLIHIPLGWGRILQRRMHDWMYFSEPEHELNGRPIECARGKVIGGSSSVNGMVYIRGNRADYDRWAARGLSGWSYAHVLPYFRRQESWAGGPSTYRGGDGPLVTRWAGFADPVVEANLEAGLAAGHPWTEDHNGYQQHGFGRWQVTIEDGRRCSAARAYLRPALTRKNLKVEVRALATRILFASHRAVGIEYLHDETATRAYASREVILAGGVINSPQLLMLSGIGDPSELRVQGIECRIPLRGVGKNLQDHASADLKFVRKGVGSLHRRMRLDRIARDLPEAYLLGTGVATDLPFGCLGFLKSSPELPIPDVQVMSVAGSTAMRPYVPLVWPAPKDGFSWRVALLRPKSRGSLQLTSRDPRAAVRIRQNLFTVREDMETLRAGLRLARDISRQKALAPFIESHLQTVDSDEQIEAHIRATAITVHHPAGTCRMGSDADAVVDEELRVHGAAGLRVVDASVMPDLVGGNINAPVIMIAERAADLILQRPALAPVYPDAAARGPVAMH